MKKVKITLYVLAALVVLGLMVYFFSDDRMILDTSFSSEVTVVDGKAQEEGAELEIDIEKSGNYILTAAWKTEQEGMITGVELINEAGINVNTFSASWMTMTSGPMELDKGKYILKLTYLTSPEVMDEFYTSNVYLNKEWDVPYTGSIQYEFASNGTFETEYEFTLRRDVPILQIAVVLGIVLGLLMAAIMLTLAVKGDNEKAIYDERQEVVRGRGYKYAFYGFVSWNVLAYILDMMQIDMHMNLSQSSLCCLILGVTIYAVYCIWNDGYFALNQRKGVILATIGVGGLINLAYGIYGIVSGSIWVGNQLTFYANSMFCGIMCVIIAITLLLKNIKDRKEV